MNEQQGIDPEVFATAVRGATLRHFYGETRTCIQTVRVGIQVGRYFGLALSPMPVRVMYATSQWWDWTGPPAERPGWSVGVTGTGRINREANGWDGHLCGWSPHGWLVDFSADQYHRPEKGIVVPGPIAARLSREQLAAGVGLELESDVVARYQEVPDRSWRSFRAWTADGDVVRRAAGEAIRQLREVAAAG